MHSAANLEISILEGLRVLPPERQQEVLDFVEFLKTRTASKTVRKSLKGIWANYNIDLSTEEIAEARQHLWADFSTQIES